MFSITQTMQEVGYKCRRQCSKSKMMHRVNVTVDNNPVPSWTVLLYHNFNPFINMPS